MDGADEQIAMYQQQQSQCKVDARFGEPITVRFTRRGGVIVQVWYEDGSSEEEPFSNVADYTAWVHQVYGAPRISGGGNLHPEHSEHPEHIDNSSILNLGNFGRRRR